MSTTPEPTWLSDLRKDMRREVRDLIGTGYVPEYYEQIAAPFVAIAKAYVDDAVTHS